MLAAAADCKRFHEEHATIGDTPLKNKAKIGKRYSQKRESRQN